LRYRTLIEPFATQLSAAFRMRNVTSVALQPAVAHAHLSVRVEPFASMRSASRRQARSAGWQDPRALQNQPRGSGTSVGRIRKDRRIGRDLIQFSHRLSQGEWSEAALPYQAGSTPTYIVGDIRIIDQAAYHAQVSGTTLAPLWWAGIAGGDRGCSPTMA